MQKIKEDLEDMRENVDELKNKTISEIRDGLHKEVSLSEYFFLIKSQNKLGKRLFLTKFTTRMKFN